jgi:hypothetical protein
VTAKEWRPKRWKRWLGWYFAILGGLWLGSNLLGALIALMERGPDWFETVRLNLGARSLFALLLFGWGVFWIRDNRPR